MKFQLGDKITCKTLDFPNSYNIIGWRNHWEKLAGMYIRQYLIQYPDGKVHFWDMSLIDHNYVKVEEKQKSKSGFAAILP